MNTNISGHNFKEKRYICLALEYLPVNYFGGFKVRPHIFWDPSLQEVELNLVSCF